MAQNLNNSNGLKRPCDQVCPGFYYFPEFLSQDEAARLEQDSNRYGRWVSLSNRRVQAEFKMANIKIEIVGQK